MVSNQCKKNEKKNNLVRPRYNIVLMCDHVNLKKTVYDRLKVKLQKYRKIETENLLSNVKK